MSVYHLAFALATTLTFIAFTILFPKKKYPSGQSGEFIRSTTAGQIKDLLGYKDWRIILGAISLVVVSPWVVAIFVASYLPVNRKDGKRRWARLMIFSLVTLIYAYTYYLVGLGVK